MKRPPRGDMPLALTLPLHFDLGLRARRRRLRRPDGAVRTYEVIALDVVDSERVEIEPDAEGRIVALATPWPFDGTAVGGQWHYVVTGRLRL